MIRPLVPSLAVLILVASLAGCVDRGKQQQAKRTEALVSDTTVLVAVEPAKLATMRETLEITGAITTSDDASIGAKNGGRITAVYVRDGDRVSAGQAIAQQETVDHMTRVRQAQAGVDAARSQLESAQQDALIGPTRSSAAVRGSEARVAQQKAALEKLRKGDREEQRRQVQAQVTAARTNMETSRKELERIEKLFADGAVSKQDVDRAENGYAAALSNYEGALENQRMQQVGARPEDISMAQEQLRAAEEALRNDKAAQKLDVQYGMRVRSARSNLQSAQESLALARQALADATIRSPFAGTISGRPAQVGTFMGPGSPVARVIGAQGVYFEGTVPESSIQLMTLGRAVQVRIDSAGGSSLTGRIAAVNPLGSDVGRVFKVRVQIDGAPESIRPGMFATGLVELKRFDDAVTVRTSAILGSGDQSHVYVADGTKAKKVTIKPGLNSDGITQVDGLDVGANVIVKGQTKLVDGSPIKVDDAAKSAKTEGATGGA